MRFGWINWINVAAIAYLILINGIAAGKGWSDSFSSKYWMVNLLEQIGRYGSMLFMILPVFVKGWKFGFGSVAEMFIWIFATILSLLIYTVLWFQKAKGSEGVLCGLAIIPAVLFLLNGILLRHPALIAVSLIFGIFHFAIVKENKT